MWLAGNLFGRSETFRFGRLLHLKRKEVYIECLRILGVHESADQNTVRHAYLDLVKRVHPDSGTEEASAERFQQVDEAFRVLQEKFAKGRRNIQEDEEEAMEFDIKHTAPQHRQYLSNEGIGVGNPFQRQKQYQQVRAMKAQERVLEHRIDKSAAGEKTIMSKGGNHFRRHAIKTKYGIDRVVEDLIQEAMSKGDFNNLNGAGKPLSSAQSQNPYLDFTTHKLNKIMLDNGFTPEWISLGKDIRDAIGELKIKLRKERIYYGEWPLHLSEHIAAWQTFTQQHHEEVNQLNKLIDKYNLIVPILENQFFRLNLDRMAERIFKDPELQRNIVRPGLSAKASSKVDSQDSNSTSLLSFLTKLL
ncbi:LOW QUALITY PROTEIN: dnaJ homolog subfamily C member 28 [Drosophila eugracilis]|uniref:LOW QUALITY PROTEIN: dnaJ homolog subfamily C member 28 n=1 Tax=Drosophila eugracilis TaxID=29029 RepID=UPI001BD9F8BF|nr:LOW QUALITY PROTEIN: dnaJ homolog subfamily C member 28 [Drosophila eugracilis]